ncbi:iron-containing alcohol dehydrogenase [SAR202 cluster bacterium AD-802-F09_MRT_200m]|nr:iron-containing alcohol dehydrogenase [SAR202 cluster bacterium AD-802-F09_MRT_200m]
MGYRPRWGQCLGHSQSRCVAGKCRWGCLGLPAGRPTSPESRHSSDCHTHHGRFRKRGDTICVYNGFGAENKTSLTSDHLYPRYAILDESLTVSMPPLITAISGMDALCHAIEADWSKNSSPTTDAYALSAAKLVLESLPAAFLH